MTSPDLTPPEVDDHYLATHDHLTGLLNRRGMDEQLDIFLEEYPGHFAALMVDLDELKKTNAQQGYDNGSELVKHAALTLQVATRHHDEEREAKDNLRKKEFHDDVLSISRHSQEARMGGDEFLLLLPCVDTPEKLAIVGERVRQKLKVESIRASVGGAVHQRPMQPSELLSLADFAMRADKEKRKLGRYTPEQHEAVLYIGSIASDHNIDPFDISSLLIALEHRGQK
ncbi:MAG TPA: GGDEF domain-containing protein [Candidatus Saccharimonadales bacterium]|nr:GGDEF domain-containing protein [Candidatus Saccharimonadales bacterium]